mgnify:CR=1 FL=1
MFTTTQSLTRFFAPNMNPLLRATTMRKQSPLERRWTEVESLVRHMCQTAQENGPVAAKVRVDHLMPKLKTLVTAIIEDERYEASKDYDF